MESREDLAGIRSASPPSEPTVGGKGAHPKSVLGAGNLESGDARSSVPSTHIDAVSKLASMFESGKDSLDLALMQVIAEGGSPSEWIAGMLRASLSEEPVESSPRPRFLGEG